MASPYRHDAISMLFLCPPDASSISPPTPMHTASECPCSCHLVPQACLSPGASGLPFAWCLRLVGPGFLNPPPLLYFSQPHALSGCPCAGIQTSSSRCPYPTSPSLALDSPYIYLWCQAVGGLQGVPESERDTIMGRVTTIAKLINEYKP